MKVLIVGSGGREHALAWKCASSQESSAELDKALDTKHSSKTVASRRPSASGPTAQQP